MALSKNNARLVAARKLARDAAERAEQGLFLVEGPKLVREALAAGVLLRDVFVAPSLASRPDGPALQSDLARKGTVHEVDEKTLEDLSSVESAQGVVAVAEVPSRGGPEALIAAKGDLLLATGVQDPGNAGALARIAGAFGFAGVLADKGTADFFAPKAVRGSAGAVLRLPAHRVDDLAARIAKLGEAGVAVYGAVSRGGSDPSAIALPARAGILVGSEGRGIASDLLEACTGRVTIPMAAGTESLNVATAAAVLAYAFSRRRG